VETSSKLAVKQQESALDPEKQLGRIAAADQASEVGIESKQRQI